jgi:hypothetical protein
MSKLGAMRISTILLISLLRAWLNIAHGHVFIPGFSYYEE